MIKSFHRPGFIGRKNQQPSRHRLKNNIRCTIPVSSLIDDSSKQKAVMTKKNLL